MSAISSVPQLLAAAHDAGLDVTTAATDFDSSGLDFLVIHGQDAAGTPWIVRTPRRPEVVAAARVEARVLRLVAPYLATSAGTAAAISVPDWRVHTDEVIAYPRLPGLPTISLEALASGGEPKWNIDPAAPSDAFVDSLARAIAALQAIPAEAARAAAIPEKPLDGLRQTYAGFIETTREALRPSDSMIARWQAWLTGDTWPTHLAVSHGDLHPGHLLLGESGAISGILDWTEGALGDPSVDLAMCHGCYGPVVFARILQRFVHHGGVTWPGLTEHIAMRWTFGAVLGAEWALRTHNPAVLEHVRSYLPKEDDAGGGVPNAGS
jgi:aminoglycoside phosphotransferase (APT) family kinase protein